MKSKRMKPLVLCFIVCLLLTACGQGSEPISATEKPAGSAKATDKPVETTEEPPEEADTGFWGRYEDPVVVRFVVNGTEDGFSWSDNIWTQEWKERFNIETEIMWNTGTDDAFQTKFAMAILTGELPDYMYVTNSQFHQLVDGGYAEDITEIYDKYIYPDARENVFEARSGSQDIAFIDGKRYGIAMEGAGSANSRLVFIRNDYMEKVGAEAPKTAEELIDLGKKFVDAGLAKQALPLTGKVSDEEYSDIRTIANGYGAYPGIWLDNGSGTLSYGSIDPEMEEVLNLYKDLYNTGYLDPTFPSAVGDNLTEHIMNGNVGILTGEYWIATWPLPSLLDEKGDVVDWTVLPVLPSVNNNSFKIQGSGSTADTHFVVVRKGFEHPEAIMKLINHRHAMLDDPELSDMEFHTTKGADGEDIANHMRCPIREYFNRPNTNAIANPVITDAIDNGNVDGLITPTDRQQYDNIKNYLKAVEDGDQAAANAGWAMYKLFYGPQSAFGIQYANYTNDRLIWDMRDKTTANYDRLWGAMQQYENTFYVNYISGSEDTTFSQFVSGWNDMGGELISYELNH